MTISVLEGISLVQGSGSISNTVTAEVTSGPFTVTNEDVIFTTGTFTYRVG